MTGISGNRERKLCDSGSSTDWQSEANETHFYGRCILTGFNLKDKYLRAIKMQIFAAEMPDSLDLNLFFSNS